MKPGITGPASLKYANEEQFLSKIADPVKYNEETIFPDKVNINLEYYRNYSFLLDLKIFIKTITRKNYE
jgi:lipopolysaccharide/colanic/teichoic acid biosynthesis glycosyltransferase